MSEAKRHHYLPVCYLEGFTSSGGRVCVFDRDKAEYRSQSPAAFGYEKHLYALKLPDGGRDQIIERELGKIETHLPGLRSRMEREANLSVEEIDALLAFVAAQLFRVPATLRDIRELGSEAIERHLENALADEASARAFFVELFGEDSPRSEMSFAEMKAHVAELDARFPRENAALRLMFEQMGEARDLLGKKRTLTIFHAPLGRGFVTSDRPCLVRKGSVNALGLVGLLGDGSEVFLPISKQVAVTICDGPLALIHRALNREELSLVNVAQAKTSHRFTVSDSEQRLRALVHKSWVEKLSNLRSISRPPSRN